MVSTADRRGAVQTLRGFDDLSVQIPGVHAFYGTGGELIKFFPEGFPGYFPPIDPNAYFTFDAWEGRSITREALPPKAYAERDAALDIVEPHAVFRSALSEAEQSQLKELHVYLRSLI